MLSSFEHHSLRQPTVRKVLNKKHPLAKDLRNLWVTLPGWQYDKCHVTGTSLTFDAAVPAFNHRGFTTDGGTTNLIRFPLAASANAPFTILIIHHAASGVSWSLLRHDLSPWYGYYSQTSGANNNVFDISMGGTSGICSSSFADNQGLHQNHAFTIRAANNAAACSNGGFIVNDTAFTLTTGTLQSFVLGCAVRSGIKDNGGVGSTKLFAFWTRAMTDLELVDITKNPWQLFLNTDKKFGLFDSVAGGGDVLPRGMSHIRHGETASPWGLQPISEGVAA